MFEFLSCLMSSHVPDEQAIIRRLKERDPEALADAYDLYSVLIFRLILRIVNDSGLAEDLMQETFYRLWDRAHLLDDKALTIGPWLVTVARHRAFDYTGSRTSRVRSRTRNLDHCLELSAPAKADYELLSQERAARIREAIDQLSPSQREVIQLAYYEGLSQTQIAERMQQPLGTVKSWARLGLQNLRAALDEKRTVA